MNCQNATGTVDAMREVIGIDVYNLCITGSVAMTMTGIATDSHHIPTVLIERMSDDISKGDRTVDGEQPSGKLLRSGCV